MTACELCGGACCQSVTLPQVFGEDVNRWLSLHGVQNGNLIRLPCKCLMLMDGKCSIYEERPQICRDYEVGSEACLKAIERYRPEQKEEIHKLIGVRHG